MKTLGIRASKRQACDISFWGCNWIPCESGLGKPQTNIYNPNLVVSDLRDQNRKWSINFLKENLNNNGDVDCILKIHIPQYHKVDKRFFPHKKNGFLFTKFAYNLITGENQVVKAMIKWKALRKLALPQKVLLL